MRRLRIVVGALFATLFAALLLAGPASAHSSLIGSSPSDGQRLKSAPTTVTLTFDESVGLGAVGYVHVTDSSGARVDARAAYHPKGLGGVVADDLKPGLKPDTYTVSYRIVSADSHPVAGTLRFVVGNGPLLEPSSSATTETVNRTTSVAFDVVRWLSYAGIALLGGAWLAMTVWPAGRTDSRSRRLVAAGWIASVVAAVLALLVQGPYTAGLGLGSTFDNGLIDDTLHTNYGHMVSARLILLGLLGPLLARAFEDDAVESRFEILAWPLGAGIAVTFAASGHADTTSPRALSVLLDGLHVVAMMAWLGGLVMLVAAVLPRRSAAELGVVLPVFSKTAFTSVLVLASTGTYAAWRGVGTWSAVFTTTYGWLVNIKIVLFLALVALGNLSRKAVQRLAVAPVVAAPVAEAELDAVSRPRPAARVPATVVAGGSSETVGSDTSRPGSVIQKLTETDVDDSYFDGDDLPPEHRVPAERLRRAVFVEVLLGVLVLVASAVLVAEPRGKEALAEQYAQPVSATASLGGGRSVTIRLDRGVHGVVSATVTTSSPAQQVTASAQQTAAQIGPVPLNLVKASPTQWSSSGVNLPVSGSWQFDLVVTTSSIDAVTTDVKISLH
ncbi:MAG: copper resistance CopC/CopD family protein [Jatrophihabitans sp.]|uniref:copper resistance CopC/CopD family protein n=1 Tax=Jatrophihabitans sp. TaxID=1932789 RepID=UPI003F7D1B5E